MPAVTSKFATPAGAFLPHHMARAMMRSFSAKQQKIPFVSSSSSAFFRTARMMVAGGVTAGAASLGYSMLNNNADNVADCKASSAPVMFINEPTRPDGRPVVQMKHIPWTTAETILLFFLWFLQPAFFIMPIIHFSLIKSHIKKGIWINGKKLVLNKSLADFLTDSEILTGYVYKFLTLNLYGLFGFMKQRVFDFVDDNAEFIDEAPPLAELTPAH